jgi:hypothetical protein
MSLTTSLLLDVIPDGAATITSFSSNFKFKKIAAIIYVVNIVPPNSEQSRQIFSPSNHSDHGYRRG